MFLKVEYQEGSTNQVQHQKEQNDKKKPQKIQHHFILVTIKNNNKAWMSFKTDCPIQKDYQILHTPSVQGITILFLLTEHQFTVLI